MKIFARLKYRNIYIYIAFLRFICCMLYPIIKCSIILVENGTMSFCLLYLIRIIVVNIRVSNCSFDVRVTGQGDKCIIIPLLINVDD